MVQTERHWVIMSTRNLPFNYVEKLNVPFLLLSSPPDYALRHPSQLLKSSHYFFFQLPRFPELMLSINDFKVVCCVWTFNVKVVCMHVWMCMCNSVPCTLRAVSIFGVYIRSNCRKCVDYRLLQNNIWIFLILLVINHVISYFLNFLIFFFPLFKSNCT